MAEPLGFSKVKEGDWLTVKPGFMRRSGTSGLVVGIAPEGASLDFFTCGQCGSLNCPCYASIEMWEWGELEPQDDLETAK
jgi:hypothetical protein